MANLKKYFSVEEANHALPLVRSIVGDIVSFHTDLHARRDRLQAVKRRNSASRGSMPPEYNEELTQMENDLDRDAEKLQGFIAELEALGVELKDLSKGLVDFPGLIEGREVCLCWMLGESEVAFWHEVAAGFMGRQSLMAGTSPAVPDDSIDPTAI
ncbi:MAG: hypothetical protein JWN70_6645 [Planctomycetaceae bacterium]|nr:hypothetical protein [Planctomycetaceae bacterium]